MKNSPIFILLLAILSSAFGQTNYSDYTSANKSPIFVDDFKNNANNWWTGDQYRTCNYANGQFYFSTHGNEEAGITFRQIEINQSKDFEIETSIAYLDGTSDLLNAVLFGLDRTSVNHYKFGFSSTGYYQYVKIINSEWYPVRDWMQTNSLKTVGDYNKLTIRKIQSNYYFFINEVFVYNCDADPFYGNWIGFHVAPKTSIAIDYIYINYLKKSQTEVADQDPPVVEITSPQVTRGYKIVESSDNILIKGRASDKSGIFEVTINGVKIPVDASGNFQYNLKLAIGDNSFTLRASDTKGNMATHLFEILRKQVNDNVVNNNNIVDDVQVNTGKREALIIGNGNYGTAPLRNPVNDANVMSSELSKYGFSVEKYTDAKYQDMKRAISNFGTKLSKDKSIVGLFYYAGHGIQMKGKNFLLPVDAIIEKEADVEVYGIDIDGLLSNLEYAGNNLNIIILDACRNNPFARSFRSAASNGLATVNAPIGTIIAFATSPGSTAADGDANNGLYTQELVKAMQSGGLKIEDVFKKVRSQVKQSSNGLQIPWENSSLEGDFYFKP